MQYSIIIPAFNEADILPACIEACQKQQGNFVYEIIVVDNNSTDITYQIANDFGVKIIKESIQGAGSARRTGTALASGNFIINIDADTRLSEDFLVRVNKIFLQDKKLVCLGARARFYDVPKWKNFVLFFCHVFLYPMAFVVSLGRLGPMGCCMVFRKSDYSKTPGFMAKLKFGEDGVLVRELSKFGKVRLNFVLTCLISSRRFKRWDRGVNKYLINFLYLCFFGKPYFNELTKS
ncbi:MAG: glycosyltransferase [Candidatus Magasanikiibacteriota bacterium]